MTLIKELFCKDNTFILNNKYIYINMIRKKFIFENEEKVEEKNDFQKILDLNKKRVHPYEVEFVDSKGNDYSKFIEITQSGILFTFDGLKDYLGFFFPNTYGEENSDGEYEAGYYESMYNNNWDYYSDFSDRNYDDWSEGYITESLRQNHLMLVKELAKLISPTTFSLIKKNDKTGKYDLKSGEDVIKVTAFLETLQLSDRLTEIYTEAQVEAVTDAVKDGISDTYCDCLKEFGIERYSTKYCFWKYELDWGSAILLFARFGTENDKLLDLLFYAIEKSPNIRHLPEYYELQYNFWDNEKFDSIWVSKVEKLLEDKLEEILYDDDLKNDHYEVLSKVSELGGIGRWLYTKDKKYQIQIMYVDDSNKISYRIRKTGGYHFNSGKTDIDTLVNMFYNHFLFDPLSEGLHIK
jgi:hypothetical protein